MHTIRRVAVLAATAGWVLAAPVGAAMASPGSGDGDGGAGGLLSNLSGRNSSGHANLCGTGKVSVLKDRTCVTTDKHGAHKEGDHAGPSGGVLSNLLFARNASGHSNNCGNETVSVLSQTTCITKDK
ncbi:hypothetical protein [Actinomadura rudentiformis]|uniref:DUF320 domain-containing protein n=1 Tax=Actinomadura rudentiformis TaxID=359158 RepID=A0A6H9YQN3_9ACTN|nr:hypothetical protein [Actinomadura rudentiformis]KAB2350224.1 hypothetical protein F8566_10575 [Actinomadura rudentiformis]